MDSPTEKLPFTKMHGLGNDFVVIDLRGRTPDTVRAALDGSTIRALADRRTGIGFDQWLTLHEPAGDTYADYRITNADGSEVGQCGNGARCVAAWLARHDGLDPNEAIRLGSRGGDVTARITADGHVTTTLPAPRFAPADVPLRADAAQAHYALAFDGGTLDFAALSLGNPHCVIYTDDDVADAPVPHARVSPTPRSRTRSAIDAGPLTRATPTLTPSGNHPPASTASATGASRRR